MAYRNLIQVVQDPGRAASAGAALGSGFGQGIAQLVQTKLNMLQQQQERSQLSDALQNAGYTREEAQLMSLYPQSMHPQLPEILKARGSMAEGKTPQQVTQPSTAPQAAMPLKEEPLARMNFNPEQQIKENQQDQLRQLFATPVDRMVAQRLAQEPVKPEAPGVRIPPQQIPAPTPQEPKKATQVIIPQEILAKIEPTPLEKAKSLPTTGMTIAQAAREKAAALKDATKQQQVINKETKPYVEFLDKKGGQAAKVTDLTLDRMEKLIDTGKLTGSAMYNFRKRLESAGHIIGGGLGGAVGGVLGTVAFPVVGTTGGATIGAGLGAAAGSAIAPKFVGSKEDQEFTKLSMNFLQNMKDIFGARVTQQEVQIFLDSIPTLSQTDEGKKAVIRDMKLLSNGWRHKKQVKDSIVSANHGVIPANIEQLVEEASSSYMDKLATQFAEGTPLKAAIA